MMKPIHREYGESRLLPGFPAILIIAALHGLLLAGCATRSEVLTFKEETHYIRARLDTLNLEMQNLRMQADGLQIRQDRLVEEMVTQSDLRQLKAYLGSRMDDDAAQLQMLSAQINDLSQRLTGVAQRVDEMKYKPAAPAEIDTAASSEEVSPEPRLLYDQAYLDLSRGNYELAKSGFEEYLNRFPDTELADNALYWLGETDYVQHNYEDALNRFQEVVKKYPKGNKVPAALFKIGLCQIQLNNKSQARTTLESLMQRFPNTPEAAQAKERLQELK
jgi:tol-pal system protein YbgF